MHREIEIMTRRLELETWRNLFFLGFLLVFFLGFLMGFLCFLDIFGLFFGFTIELLGNSWFCFLGDVFVILGLTFWYIFFFEGS